MYGTMSRAAGLAPACIYRVVKTYYFLSDSGSEDSRNVLMLLAVSNLTLAWWHARSQVA